MLNRLCLLPAGSSPRSSSRSPQDCLPHRPHLCVVFIIRLCRPAGAQELLSLVPKLMLKLQEEEEEELQVLLLSTLTSCSRLDPRPALASDGVSLLRLKLLDSLPSIRREAAAAMMALWCVSRREPDGVFAVASERRFSVRFSVCEDGKRQVCEGAVLPALGRLLGDEDVQVQVNAAGVIMYAVVITAGSNTQHSYFRRSVKWTQETGRGLLLRLQGSCSVWTWGWSQCCWSWFPRGARRKRRRRRPGGGGCLLSTACRLWPAWQKLLMVATSS